jgi:hypothetical protein
MARPSSTLDTLALRTITLDEATDAFDALLSDEVARSVIA